VLGDKMGLIAVYLILIPLLAIHWRKILRALQHSGWIIALCGLALASAKWSHDMGFTARRGILLSAMTMLAIYIGSCFDWDELLALFGWMSVVVVAGSAFMAIFVPYYGISHDIHMGAVKGLFPHKNIMGRQMVFAILTLWLGKPKELPDWLRRSALAGACLLLVLSNAVTSMGAMLVCVAMYPILHLIRLPRRQTLPLWVPLAPVFSICGYFVMANYDVALQAMGRSSTLTGRTAIWNMVLGAIRRRPWLGYGYDVFWNRYTPDLAPVIDFLQFRPLHAHNGYLDLLLALGRVGMFLFIAGFITNLWRAGRLFLANEVRGAKWPLFVLLFFAVFNFGESAILRPFTFLWIPYVSIYVSLALMMVEGKHAALVESSRDVVSGGDVEVGNSGGVNGPLPGYGM